MPEPSSGLMDPVGPQPFITEPGRYADMPDDVYHADPVVGGSLSSTGARRILESPAKFAWDRANGPRELRVFDVGRAAHTLVLGTGSEIVMVKNVGGKNPDGAWLTQAAKDEALEVRRAGKTPLCTEDYNTVHAMAAALLANAEVAALLTGGVAEESFFHPDPETGVWLRGRADFRLGSNRVRDYKTCKNANPADFAASIARYGYHQQGDFYRRLLAWLGLADADAVFEIIAQEKEPPYLCSVIRPDDEFMRWGAALNRTAIETFVRCTAAGDWPGYPSTPVTVAPPGWLTAQYEQRVAAGELHDPEPGLLDSIRYAPSRAILVKLVEAHEGSHAWTPEHRELVNARWTQVA